MTRKCSMDDFIELAEALLSFHAWYKLGVCRLEDGRLNTRIISNSVSRLLGMVRWFTPRQKGNGWRIQKFHDLLHLAVDMERFGPARNFDAGPMESGLRVWAKLPAQTSQMRGYNIFAKQVAMRTFEFQCFAKAMRVHGVKGVRYKVFKKTSRLPTEHEKNVVVAQGTSYRIYANPPAGSGPTSGRGVATFQHTKVLSRTQASFVVSPVIENFLRFQPAKDEKPCVWKRGSEVFWELRTEVTAYIGGERLTLRCHPNYKNEGPWYDWVIVNFLVDEEEFEEYEHDPQYPRSCVPCKVLALAIDPKVGHLKVGGQTQKKDVWVLVHGCDFRQKKKQASGDTVLLESWELAYHDLYHQLPASLRGRRYDGSKEGRDKGYRAPHLSWVRLTSIVARCLVVEEEPGVHETVPVRDKREKRKVWLVRDHSDWAKQFTTTD